MARWLIGAGLVLVAMGLLALVGERMGIRLGHLPGDIRIEGKRGTFLFPVVTCVLISILLSLLSAFIRWK